MDCIEVWVFPLDERKKAKVFYGGEQMDKARALFRALLPPDDTLYTSAEIVRRYFPDVSKKKDPELFAIYEAHHKALNRLMRDSNFYNKPDNQDPETGLRPRGKGKTARHPRRWNRATWLLLLSDDVYEWLVTLRQKLIDQTATLPEGTRFYCNLVTFETSFEEPPAVIEEPLPELPAPTAEDKQATEPDNQPGPDQTKEKEPASVVEPDEEPEELAQSNQADGEPVPSVKPEEGITDQEADEPVPKRCRYIWLPVAAVAATFLLPFLLMMPFKTKTSPREPSTNSIPLLSDELSFKEALMLTRRQKHKRLDSRPAAWANYSESWDSRFLPSDAYVKEVSPKLYFSEPIVLASLP